MYAGGIWGRLRGAAGTRRALAPSSAPLTVRGSPKPLAALLTPTEAPPPANDALNVLRFYIADKI